MLAALEGMGVAAEMGVAIGVAIVVEGVRSLGVGVVGREGGVVVGAGLDGDSQSNSGKPFSPSLSPSSPTLVPRKSHRQQQSGAAAGAARRIRVKEGVLGQAGAAAVRVLRGENTPDPRAP